MQFRFGLKRIPLRGSEVSHPLGDDIRRRHGEPKQRGRVGGFAPARRGNVDLVGTLVSARQEHPRAHLERMTKPEAWRAITKNS
jgi:hypothetical protein